MTREEAIKIIDTGKKFAYDEKYVEAFDIAIEALEQELCEDAVSRQIISDYVESHIQEINTGYGDLNKHTNKILRMIVDYIENMPPATLTNSKMKQVEDCVSREAVLRIYDEWFASCDISDKKESPKTKIKALPPVYSEAKVGKWIESHIPESVLVECSECGFSCGAPSFNYCPMCGAKIER